VQADAQAIHHLSQVQLKNGSYNDVHACGITYHKITNQGGRLIFYGYTTVLQND